MNEDGMRIGSDLEKLNKLADRGDKLADRSQEERLARALKGAGVAVESSPRELIANSTEGEMTRILGALEELGQKGAAYDVSRLLCGNHRVEGCRECQGTEGAWWHSDPAIAEGPSIVERLMRLVACYFDSEGVLRSGRPSAGEGIKGVRHPSWPHLLSLLPPMEQERGGPFWAWTSNRGALCITATVDPVGQARHIRRLMESKDSAADPVEGAP